MTTVLIFGAGVSRDYGYPLGGELVEQIIQRLDSQDVSEVSLKRALEDTQPYSIDSFLSQHPEHESIAKTVIAEILDECEVPEYPRQPDDFYRFLMNSITPDKFKEFKIITFNYDRSLEFYWSRNLRPSSNGDLNLAFQKLAALKILHIHGRLPYLPHESTEEKMSSFGVDEWSYGQGRKSKQGMPNIRLMYGSRNANARFGNGANRTQRLWDHGQKNLKTVYENQEVNVEAREILEKASRVFFLGFGYHDLNMKLLGVDWRTYRVPVVGTCFHVAPVELARLKRKYKAFKLKDCTHIQLFRDHYSLIDPNIEI